MQEAEIMTQQEAVMVAALYRRERDLALTETARERSIRRFREYRAVLEELRAAQFMQRPGYQNGMNALEKMN